jgi:hypothetical protein
MNIGERIAEKLRDKGLVAVGDWIEAEPSTTTIAALINQEVAKENGKEYGRGVTAGKLEALKYTPQERQRYGKWALGEIPASTDSVAEEDKSIKDKTLTPQVKVSEGAGDDKCENCSEPATTFDSEGVPLCKICVELLNGDESISPESAERIASLRRKDETGVMLVRRALEIASKLPTCQGCPDENLSAVVLAMDALEVVDTVEEVLRCYTVPVSSPATQLVIAGETKTDEEIAQAVQEIKDLFCQSLPPSVVISDDDKDIIDEQLPRILAALRESRAT